jgi:hypothetical protein
MLRRRRGLGLLGTMAVGGAAYAAGHTVANRSAAGQTRDQEIAELQAQTAAQGPAPTATPAPAQSGSSMDDRIEQLQKLADLKNSGTLTDEEFAAEKARILGS